jgi:hypothetical protein
MYNKLKWLLGKDVNIPIFIIGTGRSGTHWIGYSLGEHPDIRATVEKWPMFKWSTEMAFYPEREKHLMKRLIGIYKLQLLKSAPKNYLDKSHPNIWIAEKLKEAFPKGLFVGTERNPFATVASMMKHKEVSSWHKRFREFPLPNRMLGINKETASTYENIPFASQCAMRWLSHHHRMNELKDKLGDSLFIISYEKLAIDTEKVIAELQKFLSLTNPIPVPEVKKESLSKWQKQLSAEQVKQIENVVGFSSGLHYR